MGLAASMGSILLSAGTKGNRYVYPHGEIMIHQPSLGGYFQANSADIEIQEVFGKQSEDTAISVAFLQTENESKLIGNAFLNVGYNKILKNNNTVRIAIESNFAFRHHQTGEFSIYIADDTISTGTYSASGSYIGLGFTYIYSRPKRKVIYNRR